MSSSVSISYEKYRGLSGTWNSSSGFVNPYCYSVAGPLYRVSLTVDTGRRIKELSFTVPKIRTNSTAGNANIYARIYTQDPSINNNASPEYSISKSLNITYQGVSNVELTFNVSISSSSIYYVFFTTDASSSIAPFIVDAFSVSASITDEKIPTPATSVSISSSPVYMGSQYTVSWSPYTEGYTYVVSYTYTNSSGNTMYVSMGTHATNSCSHTFSTQLSSEIPNSDYISVSVNVLSMDNQTAVGSARATYNIYVPSDSAPSIDNNGLTINYSNPEGFPERCISGYSVLYANVDLSKLHTRYGATISSVVIGYGNVSFNIQQTPQISLGTAKEGLNIVTLMVTDSRGKTTTQSKSINGLPYYVPYFESLSVIRCNIDTQEVTNGTYYAVTPSISYAPLENTNEVVIDTRWKLLGSDDSSYSNPVSIDNNTLSDAIGSGGINVENSYMIEVRAEDSLGNVAIQTRIIPNTSVAATFSLKPNGLGAAFFGLAKDYPDNQLTVFGNVQIANQGKLILNDTMYGISDPSPTGAVVGQIYLKIIN